MCIDFLIENVQEAKFCFGYNLKRIGPTTLRKTAKLRHFQRPFQRYPLRFCSFSSFSTLIFFPKRGATLILLFMKSENFIDLSVVWILILQFYENFSEK